VPRPSLTVVEHLAPAGALVRFRGQQGTGRIMITASLAFAVAAMPEWCGREVANGFAFYVNPHGSPARHFAALAEHHEVELTEQTPLRVWTNAVVTADPVVDALKTHEQALGPCKLAVVNLNRGKVVEEQYLLALIDQLHVEVGCAVVVTMPDPAPPLPFGFDGSWQAVRTVEPTGCLVRVESTRGRAARTRLDFSITTIAKASMRAPSPPAPTTDTTRSTTGGATITRSCSKPCCSTPACTTGGR
jgi:hypothetical protein